MGAENYVKARFRSRILNISAIVMSAGAILIYIKVFMKNADNDMFWQELMNPLAIVLLLFPFIVALVLMYFSRRADKVMERILREHEAGLRKK